MFGISEPHSKQELEALIREKEEEKFNPPEADAQIRPV